MRRTRSGISVALAIVAIFLSDSLWAKQNAQELFSDAFELLRVSRPQEAIAKFKEGLTLEPGNATAHFYAGQAYNQVGDFKQAKLHFDAVIKSEPNGELASKARLTLSAREGTERPIVKVDWHTALKWLATYLRDADESFESFDENLNVLRTSTLRDGEKVQFERELCLSKTAPKAELDWNWNKTSASAFLRIRYSGCKGVMQSPGKSPESFVNCNFYFYNQSRILETTTAVLGNGDTAISVVQESIDRNLKAFTSDPAHPSHRFIKAMEALRQSRCNIEKSPFEQ